MKIIQLFLILSFFSLAPASSETICATLSPCAICPTKEDPNPAAQYCPQACQALNCTWNENWNCPYGVVTNSKVPLSLGCPSGCDGVCYCQCTCPGQQCPAGSQ